MKVVFLSPPQNEKLCPSLGIAYIAALLNKNGHQVALHDGANSSVTEMTNYIGKLAPDIVGITVNTTNRFEALELAKSIKKRYNLPIILGGPHPTLMTEQLLQNYKFIDFIVRNEGEYTTLNLINTLEKKESPEKVLGISYRKKNQIINNPPAPIIENLDDLPFPEWKFFDLDKYVKDSEFPKKYQNAPHGSIISSRGCPFNCTFCSSSDFWGRKIRFRSAKNVVDEMKMLYNLGIRFILFNDDNLTSNKKRAIEICKLIIEEGLNKEMGWQCRAEVNVIDDELVYWMKQANCTMVEFGIEDCTDEGLKWFKKGHREFQVKKAFEICKKYNIEIKSYFIIGGDHETKKNLILKRDYIEELDPDITKEIGRAHV